MGAVQKSQTTSMPVVDNISEEIDEDTSIDSQAG
jgi:hypothetical protein